MPRDVQEFIESAVEQPEPVGKSAIGKPVKVIQQSDQFIVESAEFVWVPKRVQLIPEPTSEFIKLRKWLHTVERSVLGVLGRIGAAFQRVAAGIVEPVVFKPTIQFTIVVECFVRRVPRGSI